MNMERGRNPQISKAGFSRTELAVVIALVVVIFALLAGAIGIGTEKARRARCAGNLHQIWTALNLYTSDYHGLLPDCTAANPNFYGSVWPWDMKTNLVSELEHRNVRRNTFYCPSNPGMNTDAHWNFPQRLFGADCRVLGYAFLLNGCRQIPSEMWRTDLKGDETRKPSEVELVVDATVSQMRNYSHIGGINVDRSSHMFFGRPSGGNIAFEDGTVIWRPFKEMKHQIYGQAVWDF